MKWIYCMFFTCVLMDDAIIASDICGMYKVNSISDIGGNVSEFTLEYTIEEKEKSGKEKIIYVVRNANCILKQKGKLFGDNEKNMILRNGNGILGNIECKNIEYVNNVCVIDYTKDNIMVGPLSDIADNMNTGKGRKTRLIYKNDIEANVIKNNDTKIYIYNYKKEKDLIVCYKAMYCEKDDHIYTVYIKCDKLQVLKMEYYVKGGESKYNDVLDLLKNGKHAIFEKLGSEILK